MTSIEKMVLRRIQNLGQEAFSIHEDLMRWQPKPDTEVEKTKKSVELKQAIEEQFQWIEALFDD